MSTRIIMRNDGRATAEGETEVFGTTGAQTVTVLDGATVTFRSGFNSGGDTIRLNGRASDFTVSISGSNVTFRSVVDNITVVIPIGTAANTITFDNGDSRSLSLVNGVPILGAQTIPNSGPAAPVTAGPGTYTISGAATANEGGVLTYTVTRTDTSSAETLLFSVDGSTNGGTIAPATQGADFSPASGAVVFAAGQATATFTVAVASDSAVEGLEGISVRVLSNGSVVAATNGTIIDGNTQGQALTLSPGVDTVAGTAGNDSITGRISEFSSLDTVTGGAGTDTLVLTGALPTDTQPQPVAVVDGAFQGTTGIERLVLTGGTTAQSVDAVLGTLARAAGLQEVVLGGIGGQDQDIDIRAFDAALTVTGSDNAETIAVNLGTVGVKTLNLGGGADQVDVTTTSAVAGSVQVNFTSGSVGNGSDNPVTIVSANGNVIVNDEGTIIDAANGANVFNVVGLGADGLPDLTQDRGNFARIGLGTGAGDTFSTNNVTVENTYFNGGAGNDTFNVLATDTERHFAVGGTGDDLFNITADDGIIEVIGGEGADRVNVVDLPGDGDADGQEIIRLGDGDDVVSYSSGDTDLVIRGVGADVLEGGNGTDTLIAGFDALFAASGNGVAPTGASTVTGFEVITIANTTDLFDSDLILGRIQAGITTVNTLEVFRFSAQITFDVAAATLNLGVVQNTGAGASNILVSTSGNRTTDQVTIANTVAADGAGDGQDAFNGRAIVANGVETLVINTTADGSAAEQTIGGITVNPTTGGTSVVNFVGSNSVDAGLIVARTVNAAGLTDGASLVATTTNVAAPTGTVNSLLGSADDDFITLGSNGGGAVAANVNLSDGDDTLEITNGTVNAGLIGGTSSLNGGNGIDTLKMSAADAATLSLSNAFNANQSSFEVLSINQTVLGATDVIRVDNLDVDRVISAGTSNGAPGPGAPTAPVVTTTSPGALAVTAAAEVATLVLPSGITPAAGSTFTIDDVGTTALTTPFTFVANGTQTGAVLAEAIANAINATNGGAQTELGDFFVASVVDNGNNQFNVVITARPINPGNTADLFFSNLTSGFGATTLTVTTQGRVAAAGSTELQQVQFSNLVQGQSVTVAGRTVEATAGGLTASQVADAFELVLPANSTVTLGNGARVSGNLIGFNLDTNVAGNGVSFIRSIALDNVPLATVSTNPPVGTPVGAPGAAGTIVLQNMTSGDTLELTGPTGVGSTNGVHDVRIIDSGLNTNDVLNIELTNAAGGRNYGTVTAANVETVNLILNGAVTTPNTPATTETINLNILQASTLTVSGNNGANITHTASGLTLFDASGVVGDAGDQRSGLGVTFQSLTTTGSVTMRGGIGNDVLRGNSANDTFDLTRGGSDEVQFSGTTRAANGLDVVNGFTGGATAAGDVLDLNGGVIVTGVDSNGTGPGNGGIIFNATASNTAGDLVISGNNDSVWFVTDGQTEIINSNVKSQITGATAQNGEILITDGASGYVLHAASGSSNTFNVYRVFDNDGVVNGVVDARVELLGTVNMTNTFADLTLQNVNDFAAPASTLTAADVAAASAPVGGSMMGMLDNLGSFQIV